MTNLEKQHKKEVVKIVHSVKGFYKNKKKFRIYHGTTNSTRMQKFSKEEMVNISNLNNVISINQEKKYAIVEPNVSMDRLVEETLRYGLLPPVVMEFPGITVGGGIQGGAGESSSFKYGGFHNCCTEYEILLADGSVMIINNKINSDLFYGTACSYGTLGIITQAKISLIPAKKFVKLTYYKVTSFTQAISIIEKHIKKNVDYIDGIMFSKKLGVIMVGFLSDEDDLPKSTFHKSTDNWFYLHAENIVSKHNEFTENIPLTDYLFRYNKGAFWVATYPFKKLNIPFNRFTRFMFNPLMDTRTLYRFLQAINISQKFFIQDISFPKKNVLEFLNIVDKKIGIYPLWLCPLKPTQKEKLSPVYMKTDMIINVGIWGKLSLSFEDNIKLNKEIEQTAAKLKGRKILYAHAYYTEKEFWKIYDVSWYKKLRKKYNAEKTFPDIYEKVRVKERYPYSITKGLLTILKSPFRLPVS